MLCFIVISNAYLLILLLLFFKCILQYLYCIVLDLLNVVEEAESQGKKEGFSNRKGARKRNCTKYWNQSAPS